MLKERIQKACRYLFLCSTVFSTVILTGCNRDDDNSIELLMVSVGPFTVLDNISHEEVIGTVGVTNSSGLQLTFSITQPSENLLFEIGESSGEISLIEGQRLNSETAQRHVISVGVTNGSATAQISVTIIVLAGGTGGGIIRGGSSIYGEGYIDIDRCRFIETFDPSRRQFLVRTRNYSQDHTVSIATSSNMIQEPNTHRANSSFTTDTVRITISPVPEETVSVFFRIPSSSTATFTQDYMVSGTSYSPSIISESNSGDDRGTVIVDHDQPGYGYANIAPGESAVEFYLVIFKDKQTEGNETIEIELVDTPGYQIGDQRNTTVMVRDNDYVTSLYISMVYTWQIQPECLLCPRTSARFELPKYSMQPYYFSAIGIDMEVGQNRVPGVEIIQPYANPKDIFGGTIPQRLSFYNTFPVVSRAGDPFTFMVFRYRPILGSSDSFEEHILPPRRPDLATVGGVFTIESVNNNSPPSLRFTDGDVVVSVPEGDTIYATIQAQYFFLTEATQRSGKILDVDIRKEGGASLNTVYEGNRGIESDFIVPDALISQGRLHVTSFKILMPPGAGITGFSQLQIEIQTIKDDVPEENETYILELNNDQGENPLFRFQITD